MLALAVIAVVVVMTTALGLLVGAQAARGQAQAAADLAALAGASQLVRAAVEESGGRGAGPGPATASTWSAACSTAAEASRRNGALMTSCVCEPGGVLRVATSRRSAAGVATARARAGPRSAR
ncbi:MAG: histidine kinase [Cellulomonas sp.]|uniref:histidine kinase n=1 Tax=Cellulomonas sp. TaxID=40001 RepID=UPI0018397AA6|nr:histidine kinase [Cellulomonas sp.]NMM32288.1 histidine kinase [Cellulomonas sp.]